MSDNIDYKKAFEFLMVAMVANTLSPDGENFRPDICVDCMAQGRNFAYGDDGDKKLVCDKCVYNFMNVFRKEQLKGGEMG